MNNTVVGDGIHGSELKIADKTTASAPAAARDHASRRPATNTRGSRHRNSRPPWGESTTAIRMRKTVPMARVATRLCCRLANWRMQTSLPKYNIRMVRGEGTVGPRKAGYASGVGVRELP